MAKEMSKQQNDQPEVADSKQDKRLEQLQKDLEQAKALQEESMAKAQRALADYANLKKRFDKEREEIGQYANELLLLQIIPALDNMDRAVHFASEEEQKSSLYMGVKMTLQQIHDTLNTIGFTQIEAKVGQDFDPHLHEAVEMVAGAKSKIVSVQQPGYKLKDKVVRPTQVTVGNGEDQPTQDG